MKHYMISFSFVALNGWDVEGDGERIVNPGEHFKVPVSLELLASQEHT